MTTTPLTARGVAKTLVVLAETSFGVQPTGTAQILRRNQSMLNLQVQEIDSQEILPSQQMRDARGEAGLSSQMTASIAWRAVVVSTRCASGRRETVAQ